MSEYGLSHTPLTLRAGEQCRTVEVGTVLGKARITGEEERIERPHTMAIGSWAKTIIEPIDGILKELGLSSLRDLRVTLGESTWGTEKGPGVYEITYLGVSTSDCRPESYFTSYEYGLKWVSE